jgi:molybdate transport system ATP-binding protein
MSSELEFDFTKRFAGGPTIRAALRGALEPAQVTVLFGASGSGKTTVLRCLAGLDSPDAGFIRFDGEPWYDGATGRRTPPQDRSVGLLFQDYALFPHLSVKANVGYGLAGRPSGERSQRVREVAGLLGIEDLLGRRPGQLSGGQRQRVAVARALAPRPRLLLLDEPLSALDAPSREELRGELRKALLQFAVPSIVVTHDRAEALTLGDRLVVLVDGVIRQVGPVHQVFSAPSDLAVARVVGTENVAPARVLGREGGLAFVEVGSARLVAMDPGHIEGEAFVCIRAEEVVLKHGNGVVTSARNQLSGIVTSAVVEGPLVRVTLDCGFRLVAFVTRQGAEQLGIEAGKPMMALIKAGSIRLLPRAH